MSGEEVLRETVLGIIDKAIEAEELERLLRLVTVAASRLMENWADADEAVKLDLWRNLAAAIAEAEETVYPLPGEQDR